jgi:hypothetical protein
MGKAKHSPGPRSFRQVGQPPEGWVCAFAVDTPVGNVGLFHYEGDARMDHAAPDLAAACEATLLFHGSDWSPAVAERWTELTGSREATTKVLCDFQRAALQKAGIR